MANKSYLGAAEVPVPTGAAKADSEQTYRYLCNLVGELGYLTELHARQIAELKKELDELKQGKDG